MLAIVDCAQLVTLAGPARARKGAEMRELGIINDGALLVEDGVIVYAGPRSGADLSAATEIVSAEGGVVLPGWVDAHTHAVFAGNRVAEYELRAQGASYEQIAAAGGGIRSSMRATREALEGDLVEAGRRHSEWMLRNGTITLECKSGYGLSTEHELKMLRAIRRLQETSPMTWVPTFLGAHAVPPEFEGDRPGYVEHVAEEMLAAVAHEGLAKWCDIFVERNYFQPEDARRILHRAKELGLGVRMHVDQLTNGGGASLAAELGATTADHLEQTDSDGIQRLREAGVIPVLVPASVYCLGLSKYPDARAMIDAGLPVVLATDFNPGSSPVASMPFVLSLACTQMKMSPAEAIVAATVNAAHSLELPDRGSLEVGRRADFAIYSCADVREIPYWVGAPLVREVYIAGNSAFSQKLA